MKKITAINLYNLILITSSFLYIFTLLYHYPPFLLSLQHLFYDKIRQTILSLIPQTFPLLFSPAYIIIFINYTNEGVLLNEEKKFFRSLTFKLLVGIIDGSNN